MTENYDVATGMNLPIPDTIEKAVAERNGWINAAAMYCRNEEYYRKLVQEIGQMLGLDAFTADDGGVHEDVLCAKVPELVRARLNAAPGGFYVKCYPDGSYACGSEPLPPVSPEQQDGLSA